MDAGVRLGLIILAVTDLVRSVKFYREAFGWQPQVEAPVYVEFSLPEQQRLGLYERASFGLNTTQVPVEVRPGELTGTELYFYVDDLAHAIQKLEALGARPLSMRAERTWGDEAAYFADPDGNVIVVARPLDASHRTDSAES